ARSLELAQQLDPASGVPTLMLDDQGFDYVAAMYRPRKWQYVTRPAVDSKLQIVEFVRRDNTNGFDIEVHGPLGVSHWKTERWRQRDYPVDDSISMLQIRGETRPFPDDGVFSGRALIFWYPDVARLGITGEAQLRLAAASGVRYILRSN